MIRARGAQHEIAHLAADAHGMPVRAFATRGATADCARAIAPIDGSAAERLLANRGRDTDGILARAEKQGMEAVIPGRYPDRMYLFMGFRLVTTLSRVFFFQLTSPVCLYQVKS